MSECENKAKEAKTVYKLDCSICLSAFKVPKLLPCYHTFCLQCLEEYVLRNGREGKFECPLCRVSTVTPMGGVKAFQSNFYIKPGDMSSNEIDCDICGSGHDVTHYCTDCEEHFCERCATAHMKMKVSREHKLLQLDNCIEGTDVNIRKIQKKSYCRSHTRDEIKMFCKDCNSLLCVVCKLTEHENHNTLGIAEKVHERRAILSTKLAETKSIVDKLKTDILTADKFLTKTDLNRESNIADINKRVENVIAELQENAEKLKQEIVENSKNAKIYYLQERKELQSKIIEAQGIVDHTQNVLDFGDDNEILGAGLYTKMESIISRKYFPLEDYEHMTFKAGVSSIQINMIGQNVSRKKAQGTRKLNEITGNIPNTRNAHTISVWPDRLFAAFSDYGKLYYHNWKTSKAEEFLVLDNYSDQCLDLKFIEGDVYFTMWKSIYKFDTMERAKTKLKTFDKYPHSVAYVSLGRKVLICLLNSPNVFSFEACEGCVISMNLVDYKHCVWKKKETPGPTCVAVNENDGTVCLAYPAAHKVALHAPNGDILSEFTGVGCYGNPELFCPVSVCFHKQCCIIVADYGNNAVIRIDMFGSYMQCLIEEKAPMCVVFSGEDQLFVGCSDKNITRYALSA
ncbi:uncharacterized protein LOC123553457 [Mercenaria mercenaria]|uniref:uncharacterized protein LOC123553457 n=1 Tax=Mercenaria mercenaria TaxID=6596 RepID=UPI00234EE525|nr:uncharacterized protein LOC123553457 [Mercenaria mercenaria]